MLLARRPTCGVLASLSLVAMGAFGTTACGDGDPRSVAGFCRLLREQGAALTDTSDPAGLAARYRTLEANVPLQIKDQWHEVTLLLEHVTTFDPKDQSETQAVLAESLRAKSSIDSLAAWADVKCKVPIGRITVADTAVDGSPAADTADDEAVVDTTMAP